MFRLERIAEKLTDKNESFLYSVPCTPKKKGETPIYRKPSQKNGLLQIPDHLKSLADVWDKSVWQFPNNKCCEDCTYTEIDRKMKRVGSWMKDQGHQLAYLYCKNSVEWSIVDLACWNYGMTNVPLYDTLGE
jgi:long-subunit acyl-CoA synthetase (AMP-forming)